MSRSTLIPFCLAVSLLSVGLMGCGIHGRTRPKAATPEFALEKFSPKEAALIRMRAVELASSLVGRQDISLEGQSVRRDCSGFVCALYEAQGVKLPLSGQGRDKTWRVSPRLYQGAKERSLVFTRGQPKPGDLVFFRNTYDANRDRRMNDGVTHVALVESLEPNGSVVILHYLSDRVLRSHMNLEDPTSHRDGSGNTLNDFLRKAPRKRGPLGSQTLAGELFVGYSAVIP